MEAIKNRVQLTGKIGKFCDFKTFGSGRKKATMSLSTSESYYNKQGSLVNQTYWHNIIAWGKIAEEMEMECESGMKMTIMGKLVSRSYTDKEGKKKYVTEVEVKEYELLETGKEHLE